MVNEIERLRVLLTDKFQEKYPLADEVYYTILGVVEALEKSQGIIEAGKKISVRKLADPEFPGIVTAINNYECVVVEFNPTKNEYDVIIWADDKQEDPTHIIPLKITN